MVAGIAVCTLGHSDPVLRRRLCDQLGRLQHVSNLYRIPEQEALATAITARSCADRVFFCNSGAEANEAALKLARKVASDNETRNGKRPKVAKRHEIVAFDNAFHGRTLFTVSAGGQAKYTEGFGPLPPGIRHVPFNDLEAARAVVGPRTCAVIVEPLQGEGGVVPATKAFLKGLRELCDKTGALLVFDEVQSGAGRTGTLYAYQQMGVTPDILSTAKGLGGGFPVAAMLTTQKLAAHFTVGSHGTTYGGNPLACAVAAEVLDILSAKTTLAGVKKRHAAFVAGLEAINRRHGAFREIRGMGLLLGCELKDAWKGKSKDLAKLAEKQGVIVLQAGPDVIRLAPSLLIPLADVKAGLKRFEAAVAEFVAQGAAKAA
jgi:acetylornithine/N-succinyldiaminopimelate aminotransferase